MTIFAKTLHLFSNSAIMGERFVDLQGYEFKKGLISGWGRTILSETLGKVVIRGNKK